MEEIYSKALPFDEQAVYNQLKSFACGKHLTFDLKNLPTILSDILQRKSIMYIYVA
jgi:hypothetical protein